TDNVRPDFEALWELAGRAETVFNRVTDEAVRNELRAKLKRPAVSKEAKEGAKKEDRPAGGSDEELRLLVDLDGAKVIPSCMVSAKKDLRNRGKVRDLWDDGFVLWRDPSGTKDKDPVKLSYVLCLAVGLLSVEWLTRKLLRLA